MTNPIDFIDYLHKYSIKDSTVLTHLKEKISFSDIGLQVCIGFDKKGLCSLDLEPEYNKLEYAEIDIEFHDIINYSFVVDGREVFITSTSCYTEVQSLIVGNNSMKMLYLLENGKKAKLSIEFQGLVLDYDISWMIEVHIIQKIYGTKKEKNMLLKMLAMQMSDEMFYSISKADYGDGEEECFNIFKEFQKTLKIPEKLSFQTTEILTLYNYVNTKNKQEYIAKSFSLLFALFGDYNGSIVEDSIEYWLIELCSLSKDFSKEYKEELLYFYINYLFTKHTYSNPSILLLFLIITMMTILDYPKKEIDILFKELYRLDYVKRYEYDFFPEGTLSKFKEMLTILNDSKKEEKLFNTLDEMILEYVNKEDGG